MRLVFKRRGSGCIVLTLLYEGPEQAQEAFSRAIKVRQVKYVIGLYP